MPLNPEYRSAMGAACYRSGQWQAASEAVEEAAGKRTVQHCRDWFFLAMAQYHLQKLPDAAKSLKRGEELLAKNHPGNRQFKRLQAEAAALIKSK